MERVERKWEREREMVGGKIIEMERSEGGKVIKRGGERREGVRGLKMGGKGRIVFLHENRGRN